MLNVKGLAAGYGDVQVLWDIDLAIDQGETVALVGSNGAGKSTLLRTLAGLQPARTGQILFEDHEIKGLSAAQRVERGVVLVPEGRQLFQGMSVRENLLMGAYTRRDRDQIARDLAQVLAFFPELAERQRQLAGTMSGGEQQMCAIGRGLMASPRLLLIDELSLGLAPVAVERLVAALRQIGQAGQTVLLVEQDIHTAFDVAARGYVLETGRIVGHGAGEDLLSDPQVKAAYIGL